MAKHTCASCGHRFEEAEVRFRCRGCEPEDEQEVGRPFKPAVPPRGPAFWKRALRWPGYDEVLPALCDQCGCESYERICPACHSLSADGMPGVRQHTLAIVGGPGAGKSVYFTVLGHMLPDGLADRFGWAVRMLPATGSTLGPGFFVESAAGSAAGSHERFRRAREAFWTPVTTRAGRRRPRDEHARGHFQPGSRHDPGPPANLRTAVQPTLAASAALPARGALPLAGPSAAGGGGSGGDAGPHGP